MCVLSVLLSLLVAYSARGAESGGRAKEQLKSESYTVTWSNPPAYAGDAELEVGDGNGHGGTLGWLRFRPGKEGVEVLAIQYGEGWHPYESKWPPDRAPVTVKRAVLKAEAYSALLRDLAVVSSAKLKAAPLNGRATVSSNDSWAHARLTKGKDSLLDLEWAGYEGSIDEVDFAKPRAAARLAREAVKGLAFEEHKLTDAERAWASAKFARDWKRFKGLEFYWWVRERYLATIGVVGDGSALPVLREILAAETPKGKARDASDARTVYYAINAATRLTGKDVREKPVEEMDIEKTRRKVLELLTERK